jgi:hypothetical protein
MDVVITVGKVRAPNAGLIFSAEFKQLKKALIVKSVAYTQR